MKWEQKERIARMKRKVKKKKSLCFIFSGKTTQVDG